LGVRLGKRLDDAAFHKLMESVSGWNEWEDGRKVAAMRTLSDELKSDFSKPFTHSFTEEH